MRLAEASHIFWQSLIWATSCFLRELSDRLAGRWRHGKRSNRKNIKRTNALENAGGDLGKPLIRGRNHLEARVEIIDVV